MKKKIMSIILASFAILTFNVNIVFAQETKKEAVLNLSIKDAFDKTEKNNIEIKILTEKVWLLDKTYNRDSEKAAEVRNSNDLESRKIEHLYPKQTALQLEDAKYQKDKRLKEIKRDLEIQYLNTINCDREIDIINKSIENLEEEIKKANVNINQGRVVSNNLETLKVKKAELEASLLSPRLQREESLLKIKQYLNIDKETIINFSQAKKDYKKLDDKNIKNIINESILKSYEVVKQNKEIDIAREERWVYGSGDENLELRIKETNNQLADVKTTVEVNLWRAYYDLKAKESTAEIEMLNLENAKSRYNESEIRYKAGAIDKLELQSSKLELDKQNVTTERAINDYMITVDSFKDNLAGF